MAYFKANDITKLPSPKKLEAEYEQLASEKAKFYEQYKETKEELLKLKTAKQNTDMHRLARADFPNRKQIVHEILHPELKVEPTPDADGVIRIPGKAPVMPFRKFESVYDSDAYPEDVRYEYVALEELTTRFRISFNYQLEKMPDNAQRDVILEIIHKHKDYLTSLEAALADVKDQTA